MLTISRLTFKAASRDRTENANMPKTAPLAPLLMVWGLDSNTDAMAAPEKRQVCAEFQVWLYMALHHSIKPSHLLPDAGTQYGEKNVYMTKGGSLCK